MRPGVGRGQLRAQERQLVARPGRLLGLHQLVDLAAQIRHRAEPAQRAPARRARPAVDLEAQAAAGAGREPATGALARTAALLLGADPEQRALGLGAEAGQQPRGRRDERVVELAAQRPHAERLRVATRCQPGQRRLAHIERRAGLLQPAPLLDAAHRQASHLGHLLGGQRRERNDAIDAAEELGAERVAHSVQVGAVRILGGGQADAPPPVGRAQVGGHQDDRVVEEGGAAAGVGEPPLAQHAAAAGRTPPGAPSRSRRAGAPRTAAPAPARSAGPARGRCR